MYRKVAVEENSSETDSEAVKTARAKSQSNSGVLRFRKKPKEKTTKEPVDEKGNEGFNTPAITIPAPSSRDNVAVAKSVVTSGEESDKEEGTSSAPQVCTYNHILYVGFS